MQVTAERDRPRALAAAPSDRDLPMVPYDISARADRGFEARNLAREFKYLCQFS